MSVSKEPTKSNVLSVPPNRAEGYLSVTTCLGPHFATSALQELLGHCAVRGVTSLPGELLSPDGFRDTSSSVAHCDVLIVDTALVAGSADVVTVVRRLTVALPPPLLLCTHFGSPTASRELTVLLALARANVPFESVVVGDPIAVAAFRGALERCAVSRLSAKVLLTLDGKLMRGADARVRRLLSDLFRQPDRYGSADSVMKATGVDLTIQRVDSLLASAGLQSFAKLRRVARVVRACDMIGVCGCTVKRAVTLLGYGSSDALTADLKKVMCLRPSQLRSPAWIDTDARQELHSQAVRYCLRPSDR